MSYYLILIGRKSDKLYARRDRLVLQISFFFHCFLHIVDLDVRLWKIQMYCYKINHTMDNTVSKVRNNFFTSISLKSENIEKYFE
jgi:hypothetical protein